jgi:hypothetical protein
MQKENPKTDSKNESKSKPKKALPMVAKPSQKMPTCGVSHNHCGGLCDRRKDHVDADHRCSSCGKWF